MVLSLFDIYEFCKIEVRHTFGKKKICFVDFFLSKKDMQFFD